MDSRSSLVGRVAPNSLASSYFSPSIHSLSLSTANKSSSNSFSGGLFSSSSAAASSSSASTPLGLSSSASVSASSSSAARPRSAVGSGGGGQRNSMNGDNYNNNYSSSSSSSSSVAPPSSSTSLSLLSAGVIGLQGTSLSRTRGASSASSSSAANNDFSSPLPSPPSSSPSSSFSSSSAAPSRSLYPSLPSAPPGSLFTSAMKAAAGIVAPASTGPTLTYSGTAQSGSGILPMSSPTAAGTHHTLAQIAAAAFNPTVMSNSAFATSASPSPPPSSVASYNTAYTNISASTSVAAPSSSSSDSLIRQIESQWTDYSRSILNEQTKGVGEASSSASATGGTSAAPAAAPLSVSSLPVLLSRLHSNALLNFFEFTSHRQILSIHGPSFDCLYYHAAASPTYHHASPPPPPSTIYRDRNDYVNTLGNITTLVFKHVDWQLVALHIPLIRARMTRLKQLILVANNIHSLYQLDELALLAPCSGANNNSAFNGANSNNNNIAPPSLLDSVSLLHNPVTDLPLYRRYLISLLTMNSFHYKDVSVLTPRSTVGLYPLSLCRGSVTVHASLLPSRELHCLSLLDSRPVLEEEIVDARQLFGELHSNKYCTNGATMAAAASSTATSTAFPSAALYASLYSHAPSRDSFASRWLDLLSEISITTRGGHSALGTAANPLCSFPPPATGYASLSCIPLPPLRPVSAPAPCRKAAKRCVEELVSRATAVATRERECEQQWEETVHGEGGVIQQCVQRYARNGGVASVMTAAAASSSDSSLLPAPLASLTNFSLSSSTSASTLHRAAHDKMRIMKMYNNSANPTAQLEKSAAAASAAAQRKKKMNQMQ